MGFSLAIVLAAILVLLTLNVVLVVGVSGARVRAVRAAGRRELDRLRHEIRHLERTRDRLEHLSMTDPLTGVPNYRFLQAALDHELDRAGCPRGPFALLLIDVDGFREVNSRYGHLRGGVILRELAERIGLETGDGDTLARYGGEEFVVLAHEEPSRTAEDVAARICYAVRKQTFGAPTDAESPGDPVRLTVSIGIAAWAKDGVHATTLLRSADEALARAKETGGDRWVTDREPARVR